MKKCIFNFILLMSVLLLSGRAGAQERINVTAGMEFPEFINLGLRVQLMQSQLGFSAGTFPEPDQDIFSLSGEYYYHFGGESEFTDLRPWFFKAGFTYLTIKDEWGKDTYSLLVPEIGREFNVSQKFALALEAGIVIVLSHNSSEGDSSWLNFTGSVWPSGGLSFIYRLK